MATVVFVDDNIKVKVPVGMTMRQVATKTGASMEFGCRIGDCSTCVSLVTSGMEYLNTKTDKEYRALEMFDNVRGEMRLMCQCKVSSEEGEIVVSYTV